MAYNEDAKKDDVYSSLSPLGKVCLISRLIRGDVVPEDRAVNETVWRILVDNQNPFDYSDGWEQEGFGPQEAKLWHLRHFRPKEARRWRKKVSDPVLALICSGMGYTPSRARSWLDKGFGEEFEMVPLWERFGFSPAEAKKWRDLGCRPEEAWRLRKTWGSPESFGKIMGEVMAEDGPLGAALFRLLEAYHSSDEEGVPNQEQRDVGGPKK